MKVLHVIPAVAPRYGGPSQAVVGMCQALLRAGVDAQLLTTNADGTGTLGVELGRLTSYQGVPAIFFARIGERFKYSASLARWARGHLREFDAAHIHAVFSHSSLAASRACRTQGVPYVVRPLGSLDPWSLRQGAWKKRLLLRSGAGAMLAGAAAIHYTTHEEAELAAPVAAGIRTVVVPLGIDPGDTDTMPAPDPGRQPLVLALSRLHPKKNLEALIQAFSLATTDSGLAEWRLYIAGDGEAAYRARLKSLAARSAASSRIRFTGWVEGAAKRALLEKAAVFAAPSFQENFGLGVLEALAYGVPAVVSRAVNLAGALEGAGAGWAVGTEPTELAAGLRRAMADGVQREQRSGAARVFAARFSWDSAAAALVRLYRSLPAGPRPDGRLPDLRPPVLRGRT